MRPAAQILAHLLVRGRSRYLFVKRLLFVRMGIQQESPLIYDIARINGCHHPMNSHR